MERRGIVRVEVLDGEADASIVSALRCNYLPDDGSSYCLVSLCVGPCAACINYASWASMFFWLPAVALDTCS